MLSIRFRKIKTVILCFEIKMHIILERIAIKKKNICRDVFLYTYENNKYVHVLILSI